MPVTATLARITHEATQWDEAFYGLLAEKERRSGALRVGEAFSCPSARVGVVTRPPWMGTTIPGPPATARPEATDQGKHKAAHHKPKPVARVRVLIPLRTATTSAWRTQRRRPLRAPRRDQARSKRSTFITLSHAAAKSRTNACCESSHA